MSKRITTEEQRPAIHILLAEDHHVVRSGIRSLVEKQPGLKVAAEAGSAEEVLALLASGMQPDLILTDINMPGMNGLELIENLKTSEHQCKLVVLSMLDNENFVTKAFKAGASGYLLKNVSSAELIFAIRHIAGGNEYICAEIAMRLVNRMVRAPQMPAVQEPSDLNLSERDTEVLELIAEGYTNQEIADKLFTSKRTVEGYRQNLMNKTGSRNTAALIKFAIRSGLIE